MAARPNTNERATPVRSTISIPGPPRSPGLRARRRTRRVVCPFPSPRVRRTARHCVRSQFSRRIVVHGAARLRRSPPPRRVRQPTRRPTPCSRSAARPTYGPTPACRLTRSSSASRPLRTAPATGSPPPTAACSRAARSVLRFARRPRRSRVRSSVSPHAHRRGYWLVAADGGVFAFGDAGFHGSFGGYRIPSARLTRHRRRSRRRRTGKGYWLLGADGGVFAFGDAGFDGSAAHVRATAHRSSASRRPLGGHGYYLLGADGGVFTFGDAQLRGLGHRREPSGDRDRGPAQRPRLLDRVSDGSVVGFGGAALGCRAGRRSARQRQHPVVGIASRKQGWRVARTEASTRRRPAARQPRRRRLSQDPFLKCTRAHESDTAGGYRAVSPGGVYRGAYQFLRSTWNNVARPRAAPTSSVSTRRRRRPPTRTRSRCSCSSGRATRPGAAAAAGCSNARASSIVTGRRRRARLRSILAGAPIVCPMVDAARSPLISRSARSPTTGRGSSIPTTMTVAPRRRAPAGAGPGRVPRWMETGPPAAARAVGRGSSAASAARSASGPSATRRKGAPYSRQRPLAPPAASRSATSARPTSSSARSSRAAKGCSPRSSSPSSSCCATGCPPEPFDDVRRVVELELGRSLDDVFESFERTPIAAASIAQVHAARLRTGEDVVVKVQRPQIARLVREDIEAMSWLAPHLVGRIPVAALANPPALVELFAETIVEELDFRLEAREHARHRARARRDRAARHDRARARTPRS